MRPGSYFPFPFRLYRKFSPPIPPRQVHGSYSKLAPNGNKLTIYRKMPITIRKMNKFERSPIVELNKT